MAFLFCTILVLGLQLNHFSAQIFIQPEQVHLSYGANPTQMMVTWVTMQNTNSSTVEYGVNRWRTFFTHVVNGKATLFTDEGPAKRQMYIHRVLLYDLKPGETYRYHCGSLDGWSAVFTFQAMKKGTDWSPRFAVYGDLGNFNPQSLPRLQKETQEGKYNAILHAGDFAYDMADNDAKMGDEFMRQIETIAAYVPYMTAVGNHENAYNFSNYNNRFSMVTLDGKINNFYYSFNIGPAHIIVFSTEFYFFTEFGLDQIKYQYQWLENDLREANTLENRATRPWIITMAHRPMYCSNANTDDCTQSESTVRRGIEETRAYGLEHLFYKYGVDIEFWAHEHSYERLWPLYDKQVFNGSYYEPYNNPKVPVHITTGSAGCRERHDNFGPPQAWTAFRSIDYGYTRMTIINSTHLYTEQVSDDQGGKIIDSMMLIKNNHGPMTSNM